ncbi:Phosphatidylinositol-specific phospholipase C X domain-containing protein [Entamoeba marina]
MDSSNKRWMVSSNVLNLSIKQLTLPGSHDCFTSTLNTNMVAAKPYNSLPPILNSFIKNWSKTQTLSIFQQLEEGVRYLDIRIQKYDDCIYTVHGLYCVPLLTLLKDILKFTRENPTEVLIIDINHCYDMTINDHNETIESITNLLKDVLVHSSPEQLDRAIIELIEENKSIFFFYEYPKSITPHKLIWSQEDIASYWPNKSTFNNVSTEIMNVGLNWINQHRNKVTVLQVLVTPTEDTIKKGYIPFNQTPSTLQKLTMKYKPNAYDFITETLKEFHINVLLLDYIEKDDKFVEECIQRSIKTSQKQLIQTNEKTLSQQH